MSILTNSPSPNNLPRCPECDAPMESWCGIVHCPDCVDEPEHERERDDDATLFEGQNYNWMREYGEDW